MGLAREEDRTPDTTPQNTLMTIVSSVGEEKTNQIDWHTKTIPLRRLDGRHIRRSSLHHARSL